MAAYLVADIDISNPAQFEEYKKLAQAAIAKYGGRYLIRGGAYEAVEGDWKPQRLTVSPSRVGGGPATTATIRIGPMKLGENTSTPSIAHVAQTARCRIPEGGTCHVTLTTPPPPYRVEVTVGKTWSPHDFDPRNTDQRQLGAQVGFSANTP